METAVRKIDQRLILEELRLVGLASVDRLASAPAGPIDFDTPFEALLLLGRSEGFSKVAFLEVFNGFELGTNEIVLSL